MKTLSGVNADRHRILVVESNPRLTRKLQGVVRMTDHEIFTIGEEKLLADGIRQQHPDLVIVVAVQTDVIIALSQQAKATQADTYLPIVAFTDRPTARQQSDLVTHGVDEVLAHPIDSDLLLARLQAMLNIKSQFDYLQARNSQLTTDLADRNARLEAALGAMQDLDLIKTTLVRNVGHELRTPLLQIKASVALLREDIRPTTTGQTLIDMATKAIGRLENTVGNITQLAGSGNLKIEPVDLNESLDRTVRNLERLWMPHDTERIRKRYPRRLPVVMGDKRAVIQVLQHLLDNALKFSEGHGPVEILITAHGSEVEIAVRDYGIGIPADKLESIFRAFYQIDPSATRRFDGVGVGLTLAQLLAGGMHSQITVTSTLGEGSTFAFRLPLAQL